MGLQRGQFQHSSPCDLSFSKIERCEMHRVTLEDCNLRGAQFQRNDFTRNLGRYRSSAAAIMRRCNFHLAALGIAVSAD